MTPSISRHRRPIPGWEDRLHDYEVRSPVAGIASRTVTVLVPPGYHRAAAAGTRFPVMYLHDGQSCLEHDAFGHGGWQVHTVAHDLIHEGRMAPAIFALVDHDPAHRPAELVPQKGRAPGPTAEAYLDFLERAVVPLVEASYRTLPGPAHRGLGGSSFGALLSLYGAWTRPSLWGVVMAMSPAFAYDFAGQVARETPPKRPLRIYLDSGTTDPYGGDDGMVETLRLRDLLVQRGWVLGDDLQHTIGQGDDHNETFWRARLPRALPFLFPP